MVDPGWMAGGQYLFNLLYALKTYAPDLQRVLRVTPGTPAENYKMLDGLIDRIFEFPHPLPSWSNKLPGRIRNGLTPFFLREDRALQANHIDAQFMVLDSGTAKKIPSATWLPDFQHLHYPELFTKEDLDFRARAYPNVARKSRLVILSSNCALEDLRTIAPDAVSKARILSFVAQIDHSALEENVETAIEYFHLPNKFFFLPNQFWQHKNHRTVIQALSLACRENHEITIVCSGSTYDHRNPMYFDTILNDIATLDLQTNVRILGRIPRQNFYKLMRQSLAVIQPSLFEGWSTTVEEAKSLGKQLILSDIPVHREQNPPAALYFHPKKPEELAQHLLKLFQEKSGGPDFELEKQARLSLPARTEEFANTFRQIIMEMVEA
jgi:glycosyltransferase involved in cell wall biosynthesis